MAYKYCIVPGCPSTSVKTPEKYFFSFPHNEKRRVKWLRAMRRSPNGISLKSHSAFVCEDHFNLKEDLVSYVKFQLQGGKQHRLKFDVVSTIFDCQPDRTTAHSAKKRSLVEKLQRLRTIQSILQADESVGNAEQKLNTYKDLAETCGGVIPVDMKTEKISIKSEEIFLTGPPFVNTSSSFGIKEEIKSEELSLGDDDIVLSPSDSDPLRPETVWIKTEDASYYEDETMESTHSLFTSDPLASYLPLVSSEKLFSCQHCDFSTVAKSSLKKAFHG